MRCLSCLEEMSVVKAEVAESPGFEHHTFECPACGDVEKRLVFNRDGSEELAASIVPSVPEATTDDQDRERLKGMFQKMRVAISRK